MSSALFKHIETADTYDDALKNIKWTICKKQNLVCAPYKLLNGKQEENESNYEYVAQLKICAQTCDFKQVAADKYMKKCCWMH